MSQRTMPTPLGRCHMGIGRADITPPVGIYHRCWGAASHDAATGLHAPLTATALVTSDSPQGVPHLLVALDLGWLREKELNALTRRIAAATDMEPSRVTITFSHTHSGGNFDLDRVNDEGGDLIAPYLETLPDAIAEAVRSAQADLQPVELAYGTGRCGLARNRDYWDEVSQQFVCGANPDRTADDTVMAVRIADMAGQPIAHIVNYGCHPTTLAWGNTLISPDYIGAMRDVVEQATGVPCMFLLGACGDLGPKDGFVGDTAVADRNGRQLGYAALSAIEALTPPGTEMRYAGPVVSGATLGAWHHAPLEKPRLEAITQVHIMQIHLELPFLDLPTREMLEAQLQAWQGKETQARNDGRLQDAADCRAHVERTRRAFRRIEGVTPGGTETYGILLWRIGEGVMAFVGGEPYNILQREIRVRFPRTPIVLSVLCNRGGSGYLLPRDEYGKGIYQESAAVLAPGCLEQVIDAMAAQLRIWNMG